MNKKIRNRFIALACVTVFVAMGFLFYTNWVVQKPFGIIVFLTDNLTPSTLTAARIYQGGSDHRLNMEGFPHLGLITTQANDFAVSDSAAAATAIATGQKVNNRSIGMDSGGKPLVNLIDLARRNGRATGLITTSSISDPAPAAFYAKTTDPLDTQAITLQLAEAGNLDLILGGGKADFLPEHKDGRRQDGRDLLLEMRRNGFDIIRNRAELENTPLWRAPKLLGLFSAGHLPYSDELEASATQPSLADMVRQAIQLLQFNRKGYLLVVDAGLVGKAAAQNEGERMLRELLALDQAIAVASAYAGKNSLILVVGKQSLGGLRMNGYPFRNDKGVAVVGLNAQGLPSLTWSTGPGTSENGTAPNEPSAAFAPAAIGVAEDGLLIGSGPAAESLKGFHDNTDVFRVVSENL